MPVTDLLVAIAHHASGVAETVLASVIAAWIIRRGD